MSEEHKALVRRLYQEVVNQGDLAALDRFYWPDIEASVSAIPEGGYPIYGTDRLRQMWTRLRTAFPDLRVSVEELVAERNAVVARVGFHGTHSGPLDGAPPTGKRVAWSGLDVLHLFQGKIAEQFSSYDDYHMLEQVGLVPWRERPSQQSSRVQQPDPYARL